MWLVATTSDGISQKFLLRGIIYKYGIVPLTLPT